MNLPERGESRAEAAGGLPSQGRLLAEAIVLAADWRDQERIAETRANPACPSRPATAIQRRKR